MIVWKHHLITRENVGQFAYVREVLMPHRQRNGSGLPVHPCKGCELIAYEPTDEGPQRIWYLRSDIDGDGLGKPIEVPGYPCRFVDPTSIGEPITRLPRLKAASRQARKLIAAQRKRYRDYFEGYRERRRKRWAWVWRLLRC